MITADHGNAEILAAQADAQCIELTGADACAFAQAQFSGNVQSLHSGHWRWNAWLDSKGGVRALMHLACLDDDSGNGRLLALLRGGNAQEVCAELRRYVLRAKVALNALTGLQRVMGSALPLGDVTIESSAIGFGYGDHSLWLQSNMTPVDLARERESRLAGIRAGWPTLPPGEEHGFLPPALGLEHLGAVSFDKGCYPGQEIAARLHYRGGHKRRMCHVRADFPLIAGQQVSPVHPRTIVLDALPTARAHEALAVLDDAVAAHDQVPGMEIIRRFDA